MKELLLTIAALGILVAYVAYARYASRARLPGGFTSKVRFPAPVMKLKPLAEQIHTALRDDVLKRIDCDQSDLKRYRQRVLELTESGLAVSCGVHRASGPVRLLMEVREKGDRPGARFVALVRRSGSAVELEIRRMDRRESTLVLEALGRALPNVPTIANLPWSADGSVWVDNATQDSRTAAVGVVKDWRLSTCAGEP
jgi:hypothetical protein